MGQKVVISDDKHRAKSIVHIGTIGHVDATKTTLEEAIIAYLNRVKEEDKKQEVKPYGRARKRVN